MEWTDTTTPKIRHAEYGTKTLKGTSNSLNYTADANSAAELSIQDACRKVRSATATFA